MKEWKYEHSLKWGTGRRFCSQACNGLAKSAAFAAREKPMFTCEHCSKEQVRPELKGKPGSYNYKQRHCDQTCATAARKKSSHLPRGIKDRHGYIWLFSGGKGGKYTPQHRKIMEDMIGRPLRKEETVHHRNGVRDDNRPENLELWSSRHGKGQRVTEKVADAIALLRAYPEESARQGVHVDDVSVCGTVIHNSDEYSQFVSRFMSLN